MNANSPLFLKIFLLLCGLAMFVFFSWRLIELYSIKQDGITTYATIESYRKKRKNPQGYFGKETMVYAPNYSFMTSNGKKLTKQGNFYEKKKFDIGEKVRIVFIENDPIKSELEDDFNWKMNWLMVLISLISISAQIYFLKRSNSSKS